MDKKRGCGIAAIIIACCVAAMVVFSMFMVYKVNMESIRDRRAAQEAALAQGMDRLNELEDLKPADSEVVDYSGEIGIGDSFTLSNVGIRVGEPYLHDENTIAIPLDFVNTGESNVNPSSRLNIRVFDPDGLACSYKLNVWGDYPDAFYQTASMQPGAVQQAVHYVTYKGPGTYSIEVSATIGYSGNKQSFIVDIG